MDAVDDLCWSVRSPVRDLFGNFLAIDHFFKQKIIKECIPLAKGVCVTAYILLFILSEFVIIPLKKYK